MHPRLVDQLVSSGLLTPEQAFIAKLEEGANMPPALRALVEAVSRTYDDLETHLASAEHAAAPARSRQTFVDTLVRLGESRRPNGACCQALAIIDVHHFSRINQVLGHEAGDRILALIEQRVKVLAGPHNPLARLGGDEFAILLTDMDACSDSEQRTRQLLGGLATPVFVDGHSVPLRGSAGVACAAICGTDADDMLQAAQIALQAARRAGPGAVRSFHPQMRARIQRQGTMLEEFQGALDRRELRLVFQPIVDVRDRRPMGFEALLRWRHAGKDISPALFVPIAEEADLMRPVSRWVLSEALRHAGDWTREVGPHLYVSVNLSARDLVDPTLFDRIERSLGRYGVGFHQLAVEITETSMLDRPTLPQRLRDLRQRGIRVMLDDFGTGFSTLQHLVELQCDALKVDRRFVQLSSRGQTAFLEAVVHLARRTGKLIVAEGVEDEAALRRLLVMGADCAQGWAIAHPLEAGSVLPWLRQHRPRRAVNS